MAGEIALTEMHYSEELFKLYDAESIPGLCTSPIRSDCLGGLIADSHPDVQVYTALTLNSNRGGNHQVVVVDRDGEVIGIDASVLGVLGSDYACFRAETIEQMLQTLSETYGGDWQLNQMFDMESKPVRLD